MLVEILAGAGGLAGRTVEVARDSIGRDVPLLREGDDKPRQAGHLGRRRLGLLEVALDHDLDVTRERVVGVRLALEADVAPLDHLAIGADVVVVRDVGPDRLRRAVTEGIPGHGEGLEAAKLVGVRRRGRIRGVRVVDRDLVRRVRTHGTRRRVGVPLGAGHIRQVGGQTGSVGGRLT